MIYSVFLVCIKCLIIKQNKGMVVFMPCPFECHDPFTGFLPIKVSIKGRLLNSELEVDLDFTWKSRLEVDSISYLKIRVDFELWLNLN